MTYLVSFAKELLSLFLLSAPALLFGLFLAGLFHSFISESLVQRYLQRRGLASVLRASLVGIPFPLCSCSVIPVAMALRRRGASKGAMASFLVSTPEIGADSFFLSYSLLGMPMTAVRMLSAFISALVCGGLIDLLCREDAPQEEKHEPKQGSACCLPAVEKNSPHGWLIDFDRILEATRYGFEVILRDLSPYLFVGFLSAAVVTVFLPSSWVSNANLGSSASLLLFFVLSIPTYICAASSTPIAAALLAKGVSAGAVLVFLLAGPATNLTTVTAVRGELGRKAFFLYVSTITVVMLSAGCLVNAWLPYLGEAATAALRHQHEAYDWFSIACAVLFAALWLRIYAPKSIGPMTKEAGVALRKPG